MRVCSFAFILLVAGLSGCNGTDSDLSLADEFGFRRLRQEFHAANTTGDAGLMRRLWADDAVLTTDRGDVYVGGDAITAFLVANPNFGKVLVLTSESSWRAVMRGALAEYGFESISVDLGGNDPRSTPLSVAGAQNPVVEIVEHTHSTGIAERVQEGRWVFKELNGGAGPLPAAGAVLAQEAPDEFGLPLGDETGFRRMRERFHMATITGDYELMRSVWADDAVFTTGGGDSYVGPDAITDFVAGGPTFGSILMLIPESSSRIVLQGDVAEYGFECIWVDVGGEDPRSAELCTPDGSQNPTVEIIRHSHTTGIAERVAEGHWVFKEFNGGSGPLPPPEAPGE